eukprot:gnl/TRDRNA2_/TRDRNA2_148537_c0_seq1.p2 gnl/TRDRNA2_/TRDRNA2_148537_c0~~gnl/TRDRNA2_/TRDRNA2_148537_c0_seq1.p2  ORF type:complete len:105 (-),score=33.63 gnl/TRDRNA2_/TRDRNA2_148537_c0_seq1:41-355(-)
MRAAAKYELPGLVRLCEAKATMRVVVSNAADWLRLAAQVNAESLKGHCLQFVAVHIGEVQDTEGWERLMQDKQLFAELAPVLFQTISPSTKKRKAKGQPSCKSS